MQIPKEQILDFLREQGKDDKVGEADQQLPDQVDPQEHAGLLEKLGISPADREAAKPRRRGFSRADSFLEFARS